MEKINEFSLNEFDELENLIRVALIKREELKEQKAKLDCPKCQADRGLEPRSVNLNKVGKVFKYQWKECNKCCYRFDLQQIV